MTSNVIEGLDNHSPEGNVTENENDNGSTAKKVILTAGSAVKSAATTAKGVATSDTVRAGATKARELGSTAVTTVKDPEARAQAIKSAKDNPKRTAIIIVRVLVVAVVAGRIVRRVRKGRNQA